MASSSSRKRRKQRNRAKQRQAAASRDPSEEAGSDSNLDRRAREVAQGRKRSRAADVDGPPPAPWGSFPLVELIVLIGIVMMIGGVIADGRTRILLVLTGLGLASLAGLELAVREHLAGYRSHTLMLAAVPGLVTFGALFVAFDDLAPAVRLGSGVAVSALAGFGLMTLFRNRSGGLSFKVARPRR